MSEIIHIINGSDNELFCRANKRLSKLKEQCRQEKNIENRISIKEKIRSIRKKKFRYYVKLTTTKKQHFIDLGFDEKQISEAAEIIKNNENIDDAGYYSSYGVDLLLAMRSKQ